MNEWTKEQTIEAVSRLIELTQSEEMVWTSGGDAPARVGRPYTPPYYGKYKNRRWRIQGEIREKSLIGRTFLSNFDTNDHFKRVIVELVDGGNRTLFELPDVPNLGSLLREVQRQSAKPNEVLEELLG